MSPSDAEALMAARAKSFRFASWLLPAETRRNAASLYAFCRMVDDIADDSPTPEQARAGLAAVEDELLGLTPARPEVAGALQHLESVVPALELVSGALSDQDAVRVPDDPALIRYCYAVAGTVGLMMCGVLGVRDRSAWTRAADLGIAMQLTNICRDVAEDAHMGRVYLPETRLRAHGETPERLVAGLAEPQRIAGVVAELLDLADRYYQSADRGLPAIPLRARLGVLVASRLYRGIGERLRSRGCDALRGRAVVPLWRKILYVPQSLYDLVRLRESGPHEAQLHLASGSPNGERP